MNRITAIILAALIASTTPVSALAQAVPGSSDWRQQERARDEALRGQRMSVSEIRRRVESQCRPGRWLGAEERSGGNNLVYLVRWEYRNGEVAVITVDGRTGAVRGGC